MSQIMSQSVNSDLNIFECTLFLAWFILQYHNTNAV